jgi:glycosyltransferase involved in cell wall biosynthesis
MIEQKKYPKILILEQPFGYNGGGQITLSNLFMDWPKDRIANASIDNLYSDTTICKNNYNIGSDEDRWLWPFSLIKRTGKISGAVKEVISINQEYPVIKKNEIKDSNARKLFYKVVDFLGINDILRYFVPSSGLLNWIKDFNPDVLYTQPSNLQSIRFIRELQKATHLPVIVHIMDDWPSVIYTEGIFSKYMRYQTDKEFRDLLAHASLRMVISESMSKEYQRRYGGSFQAIHNPVDLSIWSKTYKENWETSVPFRLTYRGRIGKSIYNSLIDMSNAVSALVEEGQFLRFDIYLSDYNVEYTKIFGKQDCVFVHPTGSYEDYPVELMQADLLVLANDFDRESIEFIRYSMPTKIPEYMASGIPIFIYAPSDIALVDDVKQNNWGLYMTTQNQQDLKKAIISIMNDKELREQTGKRARHLAFTNFDAKLIRNSLVDMLSSSIKNPNK